MSGAGGPTVAGGGPEGATTLTCAGARALFPGASLSPYLDVSVCGLLSTRARQAAEAALERRTRGEPDPRGKFAPVEDARGAFAALVGADPDEVGLLKNVSEAVNAFATAVPWEAGDEVVLCPELEHPNNTYPWYNLRTRLGVVVKAVAPGDGGRIPVEALAEAVGPRTRLVTVPTVSFSPGFVTELGPLAEACRSRGALLLVDAAQSVGILHTDVRAMGVDALAVASQKGLASPYGVGFLWVRRELADGLVPAYLARYGVDLGEGAHETAQAGGEPRLADGARRFDLGNYNYLGLAAVAASIDLLGEVGTPAIEAHVRRLARRLAGGMLALGLPVAGGEPGPDLGHVVAVGESGGGRHDGADDPRMNRLHAHLAAGGVRHSVRRGVLRFSLHLYNDEADVDRALELARGFVARG